MDLENCPAARLEGLEFDGGWIAGPRIEQQPGGTGGHFSFGYHVSHPDKGDAFLKALDYSRALRHEDVPTALKRLVDGYVYERDLLERCSKARLSKVILPLAHGQKNVGGFQLPVNYLIFELADGDVRSQFALEAFDHAWVMRVLHNTAIGVQQLHGEKIAHQDIKPSNLLTFGDNGSSKLADLGRAEYQGEAAPHSANPIAGDLTYAPPEQLYGYQSPDWNARRRSCDLYHLGSMILFFFAGTAATPAIISRLAPAQHFDKWGDSYAAVLPFVRDAFDGVADQLDQVLPVFCRDRLGSAFRELCDPEPEKRGHPQARGSRHSDPYAVERYVSLFNLLAMRAEQEIRDPGG
ncbi:MAG: serine/threonine-protein kinase [Solirubrobacterales bacterium]